MITGLPYILAYREQQQLFLFDKAYIAGVLFKVGGLSTLIGRFIVQFFWNPALACVLVSILLAASAFITWLAFRRSASDWGLLPLCLVPALLMGACITDGALHFDAVVSWMLCLGALAWYIRLESGRAWRAVVITVFLYFAAGPAAIVFAVTAFLDDCLKGRFSSASSIPVAFACAFAAYAFAWVPTLNTALTPALFYDLDAPMPFVHWAPWIAIPAVALISGLFRLLSPRKGLCLAIACASLIAFLPVSKRIAGKYCTDYTSALYQFEHFTVNEDWDGLIKCCKKAEWRPLTANYLNMALSYKGKLCEDLFKYDQRGPISLVIAHKERSIDVTQAHTMFAMGNIAAAQDVAFNILQSLNGFCPAMLKMNAVIEILRGSYGVADKYLTLLEKAPHYRAWARQQRHFLWNDEAVEDDSFLGPKRKSFPDSGFAMYGDPMTELYRILESNPSDKRAMDYALSFLMLAKDMNSVCQIVNRFYGSPALQSLPDNVQEAVLFQSEYLRNVGNLYYFDEEWCLSHGVTHETIRRFEDFKQASMQNGGKAPGRFRGSFWYYLTAVQI